jgi:hypothetical protein
MTEDRNAHVVALVTVIRDELGKPWSFTQIDSIFGMCKSIIHQVQPQEMFDFMYLTERRQITRISVTDKRM